MQVPFPSHEDVGLGTEGGENWKGGPIGGGPQGVSLGPPRNYH